MTMKLMMITVCVACIAAILVPIDAAVPNRGHRARPLRKSTDYQSMPQKAITEVRDIETGSCGDDCSWVLDTESGLLNISGSGKFVDESYSSYKDYIKSVVVNNGITYIGNEMFKSYEQLTSVTIANGVSFIGMRAFASCSSLREVNLPNSLTFISPFTFTYCSSLEHITIPESVTTIGNNAFGFCPLTNITIPESVKFIEYGAFYSCEYLVNVSIPDSIVTLDQDTFYMCNRLQYNEKDGVNYLGNAANPYVVLVKAVDSSITSFNVSEQTRIIYDYAFFDCSRLENVNIPNSVVYVGMDVFNSDNLHYTVENHVQYLGNSENLYHVLIKCDGDPSCQISPNTKIIASYAFSDTSITNITIPDSVIIIGDSAFYDTPELKNISIPNSVTFICACAFEDTGLTELTIPNSVTFIGNWAFDGCSSLTSLTIGSSLNYLGDDAFCACSSLTDLCYTGSISFDHDFEYFGGCPLTEVKVTSKYNYTSFGGKDVSVNSGCVECMVGQDCIASVPICKDNECVDSCGDGMYADANHVCQQCNATCKTCEDGKSCTECIDGKVMKNGECLDSCGDGMYADANHVCQQCNTTCKTCEDGKSCTECIDGKVMKNGECLDSCGDGMYADDHKKCQQCSMSYCKVCTAAECTECNSGFQVKDGKCIVPASVVPAVSVDSGNFIELGFVWFICCCAVILAAF